MTAGVDRRKAQAQAGRSATRTHSSGLPALREAGTALTERSSADSGPAEIVARFLGTPDASVDASTREAMTALLQRHRQLEHDLARLREQREEWIVSALTYKALYLRYASESPNALNDRLMRETDTMRRTIRAQLRDGSTPALQRSLSVDTVSLS